MMYDSFDVIVGCSTRDRQPQDRLVQPDRRAIAVGPNQATMELRSRGALAVGVVPSAIGVGMLSIAAPARWDGAPHRNWGCTRNRAGTGMCPTQELAVVGMFHIAETREQARKNVHSGCRRSPIISRCGTFRSSRRCAGPDRLADRNRDRLHRTPTTRCLYRRLIAGRRLWRDVRTRQNWPTGKRQSGITS